MITLVTGARGFAGSHLVDRLLPRERVAGWHRPGAPPPSRPGLDWHPVDVTDRAAVRAALETLRPSRIYHLAGASRVDTSWSNAAPHLEINVRGTHYLLEAVRELHLSCRVLVVTSALVYKPSEDPLTEDHPLVPVSPYGVTKLAEDQLALRAAWESGLDVVVARPFNHVGPRQDIYFSVPSFARQIARIESGLAAPEIRVGNLESRRDLTDVRDTVAAYVRLMESGVAGRPYNVCTGTAFRIRDVLDRLVRLSTVSVSITT